MKILYSMGSLAKPGGTEGVLANETNYLAYILGYEIYISRADQRGRCNFVMAFLQM